MGGATGPLAGGRLEAAEGRPQEKKKQGQGSERATKQKKGETEQETRQAL